MTKKCSHCQQIKPIEDFWKDKNNRDGYQHRCKPCHTVAVNEYKKKNDQKRKLWRKNRYIDNPIRGWAYQTLSDHRSRGFVVKVSIDELCQLVDLNRRCQICGDALDFSFRKGKLHHNSPTLDRMDNQKVMDLSNVKILCLSCNASKGKKPYQEFLKLQTKVAPC